MGVLTKYGKAPSFITSRYNLQYKIRPTATNKVAKNRVKRIVVRRGVDAVGSGIEQVSLLPIMVELWANALFASIHYRVRGSRRGSIMRLEAGRMAADRVVSPFWLII
jgi:hypothetical protein